jgi:hypothetical protein
MEITQPSFCGQNLGAFTEEGGNVRTRVCVREGKLMGEIRRRREERTAVDISAPRTSDQGGKIGKLASTNQRLSELRLVGKSVGSIFAASRIAPSLPRMSMHPDRSRVHLFHLGLRCRRHAL